MSSESASAASAISLPTEAPAGAIRLLTTSVEDLRNNWYKRYSKDAPGWTLDASGTAAPDRTDIITRQDFGDCFLHVEFWETVDENGKIVGEGNSGIGLQGRYEIQILDSFGREPESHQCGAFYSQKAPRVIASTPPGQWQTCDIIFRAPRVDAAGVVVDQARATVFQNGILLHNNEEFLGPTGIQYGEFKGIAATGPIILQGDHDPVRFRNVWIIPL
jgi:hypothetical protein